MFLSCVFNKFIAQQDVINKLIITATFEESSHNNSKRKFAKIQPKNYFNPFFYISTAGLFVYQNIFSEQIQAECQFEISCSEFTKTSIEKKGLLLGILLGFNQLSECSPLTVYEHEPIFVNEKQQVINSAKVH
jgi:uncharacterized protein